MRPTALTAISRKRKLSMWRLPSFALLSILVIWNQMRYLKQQSIVQGGITSYHSNIIQEMLATPPGSADKEEEEEEEEKEEVKQLSISKARRNRSMPKQHYNIARFNRNNRQIGDNRIAKIEYSRQNLPFGLDVIRNKLVRKDKNGRKKNGDHRILFFLHIHKSAGTTMCKAAEMNDVFANYRKKCNVQQDQRCCGNQDSLEAQQKFALATDLELVASESDMYEAMDTEHYRYIILLRNSRDRYLSHWKHVFRMFGKRAGDFESWWKGQPDNWNVRKICGTRCMHIPKFQITTELFAYTLKRLEKFEDILFVEQFNETYTQFMQKNGWTEYPPKRMHDSAIQGTRYLDYEDENGNLIWDHVYMSPLDDALYDYAQMLYQSRLNGAIHEAPILSEDRQAALREYFEKGPEFNCRNDCCAPRCSVY